MKKLFGGLALLTLVGCAASPKLADFPRSDIDRPLTLPKGVASWSTLGEYSQEKSRFMGELYTDRYTYGPVPLKWQSSLSDDWNLVWLPIPIAAIHQLRNDAGATTGLILGYGFKYSSAGYSTFGPMVQYFHRQKLSKDFALELTPQIQPWIPLGENAKWSLQCGIGVGPLWQAGETVSLTTGARAVLRRDSQTVISESLYNGDGLKVETHDDYRMVFPVYVGMNWSFTRQWDFGATVNYQKLGETNDYSRLDVDVEFRHFW